MLALFDHLPSADISFDHQSKLTVIPHYCPSQLCQVYLLFTCSKEDVLCYQAALVF
jgi:hypothetical protein